MSALDVAADLVPEQANAGWYLLDARDRLVDVCPEWDAVARAGGATTGSLRGGVLGRPLAAFISGDVTRMFLEAAVQAARLTGRARQLPYRCDTPTAQRRMEMTLVPLADGQVRVEHRITDVRPLPALMDMRAAPAGSAPRLWRCSMCLRLRPGGRTEWLSPASLAAGAVPLEVHYAICPRCARMN